MALRKQSATSVSLLQSAVILALNHLSPIVFALFGFFIFLLFIPV